MNYRAAQQYCFMQSRLTRLFDRFTSATLLMAGVVIAALALAILYYLSVEFSNSFGRKWTYGFRFAASAEGAQVEPIDFEPSATVVAATESTVDGVDEKEEGAPAPALADLATVSAAATMTTIGSTPQPEPDLLYRDNWRGPIRSDQDQAQYLYVFGTPELGSRKIRLRWGPDLEFSVKNSPHHFQLSLVSGPPGFEMAPIDLTSRPNGELLLPAAIAASDDDRSEQYIFQLTAKGGSHPVVAALRDFASLTWEPVSVHPRFGVLSLLSASLAICLIAIVFAFPIGLCTAVMLRELASARIRAWVKPVIELITSIPTVVIGYFGLMLVAPSLATMLKPVVALESPRTLLLAAIMVAVLLVPLVTTTVEDVLDQLPTTLRESATGIGLSLWESLKSVLLPASKAGLVASVMFAFSRAIGETMIVWMLSGGTATKPSLGAIVQPARAMPDTIAIEMGNVDFGGVHYGYLFMLGLTLFLVTYAVNTIGYVLIKRSAWRH